jgi:hypothetical protein
VPAGERRHPGRLAPPGDLDDRAIDLGLDRRRQHAGPLPTAATPRRLGCTRHAATAPTTAGGTARSPAGSPAVRGTSTQPTRSGCARSGPAAPS